MFIKRLLVTILLLPVGIAAIYLGGWVYFALVALLLVLASLEYIQLMRLGGMNPAGLLVPAGVILIALGRAVNGFESAHWMISLLLLASMAYHLVSYERGCQRAGFDFGLTLAGALYFGWIGSYLISLRSLPNGEWWVLLVLPAVWFTDAGAYLIGRRYGKRILSPRLSPKKTWEGYWGGVLSGTLGGALLGFFWQGAAEPASHIGAGAGALMGFVLATTTILGDLGESMFKRQVGAKDSGNLLPGHGGVFDRIDSWLWAAVIGYYLIEWLLV